MRARRQKPAGMFKARVRENRAQGWTRTLDELSLRAMLGIADAHRMADYSRDKRSAAAMLVNLAADIFHTAEQLEREP